jgi:DNA repair protein RadD
MNLRPYQRAAHDAIMDYLSTSLEPCVVEAATGAGKSHIIAALADTIHGISGKRVLCLQPSAELVMQNREKYLLTGKPASVYSASGGEKCTRHPVIFGTPRSVKNGIDRVSTTVALIIVDECHEITPTIKGIIDDVRKLNPKVRVVGFTATPYRLKTGYIYRMDDHDKANTDDTCVNPYFAKKIYTITADELIAQGFLTPPKVGDIDAESYDTASMSLNSMGKYDAAEVDRVYTGQGRKTAAAVADIVNQSRSRRCVIIFAATVRHANEVMASLPPELSAILTGETPVKDRRAIIKGIKAGTIKYIVNVGVLTRGFDAPNVDVVALLRLTESVSLLQQMIGRGLRLFDGKADCLILDYAGNIERHMPDGDLFRPEVKAAFSGDEKHMIEVACPSCGTSQEFSARPNTDLGISPDGYFTDLDGNVIETPYGPMPAHYGRRCCALLPSIGGKFEQCTYRWTSKQCPECGADNDIAAKHCTSCGGEIVDPNTRIRLEFKAMKSDATRMQVDSVLWMNSKQIVSKAGNPCLVVTFGTSYRSVTVYFREGWHPHKLFMAVTDGGKIIPKTITYKKDGNFFNILAYNQEEQVCEIPE